MIIERHPSALYVRLPRFLERVLGFREVWIERERGTPPWFAVDPAPGDRVVSFGCIYVPL